MLLPAVQREPVAEVDGSDARRWNHVRLRWGAETIYVTQLLAGGPATESADDDLLDKFRQDKVRLRLNKKASKAATNCWISH